MRGDEGMMIKNGHRKPLLKCPAMPWTNFFYVINGLLSALISISGMWKNHREPDLESKAAGEEHLSDC